MGAPSTPDRRTAHELVLLSPAITGDSGVQSRKRRVTPQYEASSPGEKTAVFGSESLGVSCGRIRLPAGLRPLGWPTSVREAVIETKQLVFPNPLRATPAYTGSPQPNPLYQSPPGPSELLRNARTITLPFDLRQDPDAFADDANVDLLELLFPHTTGVAIDEHFLYIYVSKMPPKPWPLVVAGLSLYLAPFPSHEHIPLPIGRLLDASHGTIADHLDGRDANAWDSIFEVILEHFLNQKISITQVIYWGYFISIILEHKTIDTAKLPWKAAGIFCQYLFDDEMGKPLYPQARRQEDPSPGNLDLSEYTTLQPGLRVTSSFEPSHSNPTTFLSTTSGVLVKDINGNKFMTVASHGFPDHWGTDVYHSLPSTGRRIGEIMLEVTHTDIGMVLLEPNERFSNITFETNATAEPLRLKELVSTHDIKVGTEVRLDSPDTGCIPGMVMGKARIRVPSDNPLEPKQRWLFTMWVYNGQDNGSNLLAGMSGSAIWTEEGQVLGFFRYAPVGGGRGNMDDWCCGIGAEELINRGYSLVNTSEE